VPFALPLARIHTHRGIPEDLRTEKGGEVSGQQKEGRGYRPAARDEYRRQYSLTSRRPVSKSPKGNVNVDEEAIERAYATPAGPRRSRGAPPAGGRRRGRHRRPAASRRCGGPQRAGRAIAAAPRPPEREESCRSAAVGPGRQVPSGPASKTCPSLLGIAHAEIIKVLMGYGEMVTITQRLPTRP